MAAVVKLPRSGPQCEPTPCTTKKWWTLSTAVFEEFFTKRMYLPESPPNDTHFTPFVTMTDTSVDVARLEPDRCLACADQFPLPPRTSCHSERLPSARPVASSHSAASCATAGATAADGSAAPPVSFSEPPATSMRYGAALSMEETGISSAPAPVFIYVASGESFSVPSSVTVPDATFVPPISRNPTPSARMPDANTEERRGTITLNARPPIKTRFLANFTIFMYATPCYTHALYHNHRDKRFYFTK